MAATIDTGSTKIFIAFVYENEVVVVGSPTTIVTHGIKQYSLSSGTSWVIHHLRANARVLDKH